MNYSSKIITGERIQQMADIYIGTCEDLNYNPLIRAETHKHVLICDICDICIYEQYDNPYCIFFYTHRISEMSAIIRLFKNPFVLLSHNSDTNIHENEDSLAILNCHKLEKWYTQNLCFYHPKIFMLPIGFANSMWDHGNLSLFDSDAFLQSLSCKSKKIYFNFSIHTNPSKRQICYDEVSKKVQWLHDVHPIDNLLRMKEYEFCICPEGNGVDCHRLWEALYLKCVPIVVNSPFVCTLQRYNIPMVILEKWDDLDIDLLQYSNYTFEEYTIDKVFYFPQKK
jgi:hypothetical protein